jgi:ribonuclease VapC
VIVVDASALLAILLEEDDGPRFLAFLAGAQPTVMSAVNYWEALVRARVVECEAGQRLVYELLETLGVGVDAPDANLTRRAAVAFARFRGRAGGQPNLGDTFAYALAEREGDGLLFKGNDFPKTDVKPALP